MPASTQSIKTHTPANRRAFLAASARGALALGLAGPAALAAARSAGLSTAARSMSQPSRSASTGHVSPFGWSEIRPGVFATSNISTGGNCLAVAGSERTLLVDTKFPAFAPTIARDVQSLTGSPVTHVVNTHHHGDHSGGNLVFTQGGVVIAHANGVARVRAQFDRNLQGVTGGKRMADRVDEAFREAIVADAEALLAGPLNADSWVANTPVSAPVTGIDLGGEWVEVRSFGRPSHTDNDLIVRLNDANVVHTGDVVFNGVHPFFDANGGASSLDWMATLEDIAAMCDPDTRVVPGHGPVGGVEIVRAQHEYIEQLRKHVRAEIDAGTPIEELRTKAFPFMEGMGFEALRENAIVFVYGEMTNN